MTVRREIAESRGVGPIAWRKATVPRVEPRGREAYLKQYVDRLSGEPARLRAETPHAGLSQQRIRNCSRNVYE
jgi:hypothetical protein